MTLIRREDAIEAVEHIMRRDKLYLPINYKERRKALVNAITMIKKCPSTEADWIPCNERLPSEKDGQVLVTKHGEVRIATYSEFSGTWYVGEMCAVGGEDPIAWTPLPKPYREDGEA